eukprot:GGOE01024879.1.p5 GENE.GGOE01024879.1~~GGOE01024879.1.p5  ORF type:complete len:106 (+),score=9.52 GGOE01024879.1:353-670(+)
MWANPIWHPIIHFHFHSSSLSQPLASLELAVRAPVATCSSAQAPYLLRLLGGLHIALQLCQFAALVAPVQPVAPAHACAFLSPPTSPNSPRPIPGSPPSATHQCK